MPCITYVLLVLQPVPGTGKLCPSTMGILVLYTNTNTNHYYGSKCSHTWHISINLNSHSSLHTHRHCQRVGALSMPCLCLVCGMASDPNTKYYPNSSSYSNSNSTLNLHLNLN
jgi:hypothetical protein